MLTTGHISIFSVALAATVLLIPLVSRLARRVGAVSTPGGRHIHEHSTPRLGGLAMCGAFLAALGAAVVLDLAPAAVLDQEPDLALGLILGAVAMCAVGVVDDIRGMRPRYKLLLQIVVAVFAYRMGFRISGMYIPLLGSAELGIFDMPVTVFWIVGVVNAVNLIDGLDGLAGGVVLFAALTSFVVALISGQPFAALMMVALLGCTLGFLFFNFNPAKIFMGDSGSYFLGFILAASSVTGALQKASTAVSLLVPIIALGVPIFDTLFAVVRRFLEHKPLFSPDRGHIHHRLLDMGLTHRRAVLAIYLVCVLFTLAAIAFALGRQWQVGVALVCGSTAVAVLARVAGVGQHIGERRARRRAAQSDTPAKIATDCEPAAGLR